MTKFYGTKNTYVNHTRFGGIIYPSDYNTDYKGKTNTHGSSIAARIVADRNFDNKCRKNIEFKERNKQYGK